MYCVKGMTKVVSTYKSCEQLAYGRKVIHVRLLEVDMGRRRGMCVTW
jgi:hypothetical protein